MHTPSPSAGEKWTQEHDKHVQSRIAAIYHGRAVDLVHCHLLISLVNALHLFESRLTHAVTMATNDSTDAPETRGANHGLARVLTNGEFVYEDKFVPKSILLTGGAGFIGSHVAILLAKQYPDYKVCFKKLSFIDLLAALVNQWLSGPISSFEFGPTIILAWHTLTQTSTTKIPVNSILSWKRL